MPDNNLFGEIGDTDMGEGNPPESQTGQTAEGQESQTQDQNLPFHEHPRWKEVYGTAQRVPLLEKELAELKTQMGKVQKQGQPEGQKTWEPKTWDEVVQRSVEATFSRLYQTQQEVEVANNAADQALDGALNQLKSQVGDFDEQKLLQFCLDHKIQDVFVGYDLLNKVQAAEKAGEKQALRKKVAPIGSSAKTEGGAKQSTPYQALRKKSLDDIVAEATERIS